LLNPVGLPQYSSPVRWSVTELVVRLFSRYDGENRRCGKRARYVVQSTSPAEKYACGSSTSTSTTDVSPCRASTEKICLNTGGLAVTPPAPGKSTTKRTDASSSCGKRVKVAVTMPGPVLRGRQPSAPWGGRGGRTYGSGGGFATKEEDQLAMKTTQKVSYARCNGLSASGALRDKLSSRRGAGRSGKKKAREEKEDTK
jgi:hypothetical protein